MNLPHRKKLIFYSAFVLVVALLALLFWPASPIIVAVPTPTPITVAAIQKPQADLILDLFEPDSESLAAQHSNAAISAQIEHAMVVSFLLARCDLINHREYGKAYNAFIRYAVATHLAADFPVAALKVRAIASSASASYALVYSRVPCTDASLPPLVDQLKSWREKFDDR